MSDSQLDETLARIGPLDEAAMESARRRQAVLTKPTGSLGYLEDISVQLAGITGQAVPVIARKAIVVAAGDHGVASEGVSAYPAEVTAQMVANFLDGGAAINVLSRHVGADVIVVDAGVAADLPAQPGLLSVKVAKGTGNIAAGPAMSGADARALVEAGIRIAADQVAGGAGLLGTGDMGIGNTTPSSAITAVFTGADAEETTGTGTGVSDSQRRHKVDVVRRAIAANSPDPTEPLSVLAKVGGFEIAVLAGVILGAAAAKTPVVLDGFVSGAAALVANALSPNVRKYVIAAHRSAEPGHRLVLSHLGLRPLLELDLRLGEGTGAALALSLVEAAAKCLAEMATFDEASVSDRA